MTGEEFLRQEAPKWGITVVCVASGMAVIENKYSTAIITLPKNRKEYSYMDIMKIPNSVNLRAIRNGITDPREEILQELKLLAAPEVYEEELLP